MQRQQCCRPESDRSRLVEIYGVASIHPVRSSTKSCGQGISDRQPQFNRLKNSPRWWVLCDRQNRSAFRRFGCWCILSEWPPLERANTYSPFFLPNNHPVVHEYSSCPPTPCRSTTSERNSGGSECSSSAGPMQAKPRSSRKSATRQKIQRSTTIREKR